jgi:hypothetical protein
LKRARVATVQVPILTVLLVVAWIAFFIRGSIEMSRLLRWMDNRMMVHHYRAAILRAENSGRLKDARIMRMQAFVQRAERDRPGTSDVLCLIGCSIGTLVAAVAVGRGFGAFLVAAILRRAGFQSGTIYRASDGSGSWFYTRGTFGQVKVYLDKDGEVVDTNHDH